MMTESNHQPGFTASLLLVTLEPAKDGNMFILLA